MQIYFCPQRKHKKEKFYCTSIDSRGHCKNVIFTDRVYHYCVHNLPQPHELNNEQSVKQLIRIFHICTKKLFFFFRHRQLKMVVLYIFLDYFQSSEGGVILYFCLVRDRSVPNTMSSHIKSRFQLVFLSSMEMCMLFFSHSQC